VGLISRAIEAAGILTVSITSAWSITASANPSRAVYTDFPLGHTAGRPHDPHGQLAIVRAALDAVYTIEEPGTILPIDMSWPDQAWREDARELVDHRTERHDTPQYQNAADRDAAIEAHGAAAT